ncbi:MAG: Ppx/GppA family phosphatase [Solirubrobacterales bacterium]|nr:Ppx/GppA family phosphatase [Solirubrobacterales bacterium]
MRVAAIDMGTNSTRLLVADVGDGMVDPVRRESRVTGFGRGVEISGSLSTEAIEGVFAAVGDYLDLARDLGAAEIFAFATSAARDASNAAAFMAELRERYDLRAQILTGAEEAELTYLGARGSCENCETVIVDIGGGSTELVVGSGGEPGFNTSLQLGVVRHTERYLRTDPPATSELESLSKDVSETIDAELAAHPGVSADRGVAVAGTPAILAAMDLGLERVDYGRIEGHELELETVQKLLSRLSSLPLAERRAVPGVDPDRAPTIVAGVIILIKTMRAFALQRITVSERDILFGAALRAAARPASAAG